MNYDPAAQTDAEKITMYDRVMGSIKLDTYTLLMEKLHIPHERTDPLDKIVTNLIRAVGVLTITMAMERAAQTEDNEEKKQITDLIKSAFQQAGFDMSESTSQPDMDSAPKNIGIRVLTDKNGQEVEHVRLYPDDDKSGGIAIRFKGGQWVWVDNSGQELPVSDVLSDYDRCEEQTMVQLYKRRRYEVIKYAMRLARLLDMYAGNDIGIVTSIINETHYYDE